MEIGKRMLAAISRLLWRDHETRSGALLDGDDFGPGF
jgi:hypothetical protein